MRTEHCKLNRLFGPIMQVISYTAGESCTNWMSAFFFDIVVISLFSCLLIIIMAAIVCVNHHSRQIMNESTTPMLAKAKKCQSIQWETIFYRHQSVMLNKYQYRSRVGVKAFGIRILWKAKGKNWLVMVKRSKEKLEQMEIFDRRSVDILMILFPPIGLTNVFHITRLFLYFFLTRVWTEVMARSKI